MVAVHTAAAIRLRRQKVGEYRCGGAVPPARIPSCLQRSATSDFASLPYSHLHRFRSTVRAPRHVRSCDFGARRFPLSEWRSRSKPHVLQRWRESPHARTQRLARHWNVLQRFAIRSDPTIADVMLQPQFAFALTARLRVLHATELVLSRT